MNIANKALVSFCILLLIFILSACKQTEQSHENINTKNEQSHENTILENEQHNISYSFKNPNTGQEFNIIHAYLLYEDYFATVKDNPDESHYKLYQQGIIKPIYKACFKDAEHPVNPLEWTPKESDFDSIEKQIESMNKDHLNEVFEESLVKSSDILSSDKKTTVCIFPKNEILPSDMMTIGSGKIIVSYSKFDNSYKPGISHEYHHSVWIRKHYTENYFLTGLDHFILEGQALMFETLVYPDLNNTHYVVDERFNKEYWSRIEPYLERVAPREITEMIIGGFNGLPYAYGYSEGYKMVRSYLNMHPNMTVEEWTSKNSEEIFKEGNFRANYE
ncbi:Zn-dependent protease [Sporosarcina sp. E16_3]|uniref:DUF2268 domain-containing putative Zn-dependent protease n=1 Tax=unclassified Sporosarcina TaxID=2647733 RepID=UPI00164563A2|nr:MULTISPECIES: DUF2268 domain-containing putative Zn-dependent protease [unclassified Sporosarcina]MBO0602226.1 Zn-dependent protease [Sporosarcina sp. E16_3]